jgi:DNA repair exonuclease SbcCD ATPase subunit
METEVAAKKAVAAQLEERFRMRCEAMERQRAEELRQERARSTAGRQEEIDSLRAALANANAALAQAKAAAPPSQPLATQPPRSAETDDALRAQIAELEQDNHELEQTVRYQEQEIASLESKLAELQAQASLEDNAATQLDARTAPVGGTGASSNTSDGSMRQGLLRGTSPAPAEALAVDSSPSLSVVRSDEKREEAALAQTQNDKHESDKGGGMTPGNNLEHQFHSAHDADSISSVATVPSAEEAVL